MKSSRKDKTKWTPRPKLKLKKKPKRKENLPRLLMPIGVWKTHWLAETAREARWLWCSKWASIPLEAFSVMIRVASMVVNPLTQRRSSWTQSTTSCTTQAPASKSSWKSRRTLSGSKNRKMTPRKSASSTQRCASGRSLLKLSRQLRSLMPSSKQLKNARETMEKLIKILQSVAGTRVALISKCRWLEVNKPVGQPFLT